MLQSQNDRRNHKDKTVNRKKKKIKYHNKKVCKIILIHHIFDCDKNGIILVTKDTVHTVL